METAHVSPKLLDFEKKISAYHLRGQWQADANRPQNARKNAAGNLYIEPTPAGVPHIWRWSDMQPFLREACEAMPESNTARRALIFTNPKLQRGTTHTMISTLQIVRAGEIAWAHRHMINALRVAIKGGPEVFTTVNGRPLAMHPYDVLLTPGWTWHDHHNQSSGDAVWLDALDVPFTLATNQQFYEDYGEVAQPLSRDDATFSPLMRGAGAASEDARPYRYAWSDMEKQIAAGAGETPDPCRGRIIDYVNPLNNGPVLPTIHVYAQVLPPGFEGEFHRETASTMSFVVRGEGRTVFADQEIDWATHDSLVTPNWTWRRFINRSKREAAVVIHLSDAPILTAFGFYRLEDQTSQYAPAPGAK